MIRRLAGVLLVACALSALPAADASAETPPGPRLSFMQVGGSGLRLATSNAAGGEQVVIADSSSSGPLPFGSAAWSADGSQLVFPGVARDGSFGGIYLVRADGRAMAPVYGTGGGSHPVLSPDGRTLAFTRERERSRRIAGGAYMTVYDSVSTWLIRIGDGPARRITPWQNGLFEFPSSFNPDGSILAVTREREERSGRVHDAAIALRLNGSQVGVLAKHAREPTYSPDGTRLALTIIGKPRPVEPGSPLLFNPTDIALASADGSELTKLTHTPREVEQEPSWGPSGERLAFTQHGLGLSGYGEIGGSIMEINADGTCRTKILGRPGTTFRAPTWQPGPGHEAGLIAC